jgi:hypothetical protein
VENLIGTTTSSSIGTVIPQYPVCGLFLPLAKVGVIFTAALNLLPSLFIKYVFVEYSPFFIDLDSQVPTF